MRAGVQHGDTVDGWSTADASDDTLSGDGGAIDPAFDRDAIRMFGLASDAMSADAAAGTTTTNATAQPTWHVVVNPTGSYVDEPSGGGSLAAYQTLAIIDESVAISGLGAGTAFTLISFNQDALVGTLGALVNVTTGDPGNGALNTAYSVDGAGFWHTGNTMVANSSLPSVTVTSAGWGHAEYYSFHADAGQTVTLDVDFAGAGYGVPSWDAAMALFDPSGKQVAINDDAAIGSDIGSLFNTSSASSDPYITYTATTSGTYTVEVGAPHYTLMQSPTGLIFRQLSVVAPTAGDQYVLNISEAGHASTAATQASYITQFGDSRHAFNDLYIVGSNGPDAAYANYGDDLIYMGGGDDTVYASPGTDFYDGGSGNNTLSFTVPNVGGTASYIATPVTVNLASGQASFPASSDPSGDLNTAGSILFVNFENVVAAPLNATSITGDGAANFLQGLAGNDTILGAGGNDTITGGQGDDSLDGGAGFDIISYFDAQSAVTVDLNLTTAQDTRGLGTDTLKNFEELDGSPYADRLYAAASGSVLAGSDGNDVLVGRDGNDTLVGGVGDDNLAGGNGDDYMYWDAGNDAFFGDAGLDTVDFSRAGAAVHIDLRSTSQQQTGDGNDLFNGIEQIYATNLADSLIAAASGSMLHGLAGADTLTGGAGNDVLDGGAGNDSMVGGAGNDTYYVDVQYGDLITEAAGGGADLVYSSVSFTLPDNVEALVLTGTAAINGASNNGGVTITGNVATNVLSGGAGNDTLHGGDGNDSLYGFVGNDVLDGGTGNDTMVGGVGDDAYYVDVQYGDVVTEKPNEGTDTVYSSVSYTLPDNVEVLVLTGTAAINGASNNGGVTIIGNIATNVMSGGDGNDSLYGGDGNDSLYGFNGDDTLDGGTGADTMTGSVGNDTYFVDDSGDVVTEAANQGIDTVNAAISYTLGANLEILNLIGTAAINGTGNNAGDTITGNSAANLLTGGTGNDILSGGDGNDTLAGVGGRDIIDGGAGTDVLTLGARRASYTVYTIGSTAYFFQGANRVAATNVESVQFGDQTVGMSTYLSSKSFAFDGIGYLASYADLIQGYGPTATAATGAQHFAQYGFLEGRSPTPTFNALEYLASNVDLAKGFGADIQAAETHYVQHGYFEGRSTNSFDALEYLASNPDLARGYGTDTTAAELHYIQHGIAEGRSVNSFDPLQYLAANTDLAAAYRYDPVAAETHYIQHGLAEGRATSGFDATAYLLSSGDLAAAGFTVAQALAHWVTNGAAEGRPGDSLYGREQTNHADTLGTIIADTLETGSDRDWFALTLAAGQHVSIDLYGAGFAPTLAIADEHGVQKAVAAVTSGSDAVIDFTADHAATYYLTALSTNGVAGNYSIDAHLV